MEAGYRRGSYTETNRCYTTLLKSLSWRSFMSRETVNHDFAVEGVSLEMKDPRQTF